MANRRSIDPGTWEDEDLGMLSHGAFRLWIGCLSNADDEGRLDANPRRLRGVIFRYLEDVTTADIERWLTEITTALKSFCLYQVGDKQYVAFLKWRTYQTLRSPKKSKIPEPPSSNTLPPCNTDAAGVQHHCSKSVTSTLRPCNTDVASTLQPCDNAATSTQQDGNSENTNCESYAADVQPPCSTETAEVEVEVEVEVKGSRNRKEVEEKGRGSRSRSEVIANPNTDTEPLTRKEAQDLINDAGDIPHSGATATTTLRLCSAYGDLFKRYPTENDRDCCRELMQRPDYDDDIAIRTMRERTDYKRREQPEWRANGLRYFQRAIIEALEFAGGENGGAAEHSRSDDSYGL